MNDTRCLRGIIAELREIQKRLERESDDRSEYLSERLRAVVRDAEGISNAK